MEEQQASSLVFKRNVLLWSVLIAIGTVTYLAGFFFPHALIVQNKYLSTCPRAIYEKLGYTCENSFHILDHPIVSMEVSGTNANTEFISLRSIPVLSERAGEVSMDFELSTFAVNSDLSIIEQVGDLKEKKTVKYDCSGGTECQAQILKELYTVNRPNYVVVIKIRNSGEVAGKHIDNIRLAFITNSVDFSSKLLILKYALFAAALIGFVAYRYSISKLAKGFTSIEQKQVGYMGLVLVFFTQPFIHYVPSEDKVLPAFVGVVIISAQTALVILFWLTLIEKLSAFDYKVPSGAKKVVHLVTLVHFCLSVGGFTLLLQEQSDDPLTTLPTSHAFGLKIFKLYLIAFVVVISAWSAIRFLRIIRRSSELDWREGTSFNFSICYTICYLFFIATAAVQPIIYQQTKVVLLLGITTLYTLLLQILYAPFKHEVDESERRRKYENPTAAGQYGDLDLSDGTPSRSQKSDNVKLRPADQLKDTDEVVDA